MNLVIGLCLFFVDLLFKDYHSDQKFTVTTYSPTGVVSVHFLVFLFFQHKRNACHLYLFCCWVCYWMFYLACVDDNVGRIEWLVGFVGRFVAYLGLGCKKSLSWIYFLERNLLFFFFLGLCYDNNFCFGLLVLHSTARCWIF